MKRITLLTFVKTAILLLFIASTFASVFVLTRLPLTYRQRTAADPAGNIYFLRDGCAMREPPDDAQSVFVAPPAFLRRMTADTLRIAGSLLLPGLLIMHLGKEKLTGRNQI